MTAVRGSCPLRTRMTGSLISMPKTRRYLVTDQGFRAALFINRAYARLLRPGLAALTPEWEPPNVVPIRRAFEKVDQEIRKG